ncbi:GGDEF domain-containing protein [Castellaniella caeni]|uniref:GGDEF domain-containing protein n=1 Tax=Castellaniella caeni TaxID=266123 RepID=UPI0011AF0825|nr:GGDEF domain-containing protein [Castellaniella caeni]
MAVLLNLDPGTLLVVEAFVLFMLGCLTCLAAFQGQRDRPLLWTAAGMWMACLGFLLGVVRTRPGLFAFSIVLANFLLITSHACLWVSLRVFRGRPAPWRWLGLGGLVWLALCQWPFFLAEPQWRVVAYSALSLGYLVAGLLAIWPEWRRDPVTVTPVLVFLGEHAVFYFWRALPIPLKGALWQSWPDFSLVMVEGLFFSICLAFGILMLVRARAEQKYRHAALHDTLTSLPNRRALFEQGAALLEQTHQEGGEVSLLMCDLDWFKQVNDRHGHEAGDRVLVRFAQVLLQTAREGDLCARLGGEEFVVVTANLGPLGAQDLAARIRYRLAGQAARFPCPLTVSVGVSCSRDVGYDLDRLLARADQALYAAKTAGRDCVRIWSQGGPEPDPSSTPVSRSRLGRFPEHPVDA